MAKELGVVKYDITNAAIKQMETDYMVLTVQGLDDEAGFKVVHEARMVVKTHRVAVEKKRKDLKAYALDWGRRVDSEAKRITGLLEPIETHLQTEEDKVTKEKERIRTQKILDEQERVAGIRDKIQEFRQVAADIGPDMRAEDVQAVLNLINGTEILESDFQEFREDARLALSASKAIIEARLKVRIVWEEDQAKAKAESARLEKGRMAQEAEAKRLEQLRLSAEENARIAREFLEAERAALEAEKAAEAQRKRQAEFEKQALENARIAAEKAAAEKVLREAREKKEREEAEAAEKARQEALKPDKEKLLSFADSISTLILPDISDKVADAILEDAIKILTALARKIRKSAKEL